MALLIFMDRKKRKRISVFLAAGLLPSAVMVAGRTVGAGWACKGKAAGLCLMALLTGMRKGHGYKDDFFYSIFPDACTPYHDWHRLFCGQNGHDGWAYQ